MATKTRCPECDSTQCYHREKTKDFICQKCGHVWSDTQKEGLQ